MEVLGPLQDSINYAGSELSRMSGLTALKQGKQMLDQGGDQAELVVLAKRMACDAVAADEALARGVEAIVGLYEEATRLCQQAAAASGASPEAARALQELGPRYGDRAAVFRQVRSLVSGPRPPAPAMSSEEWHAARVLLPVRTAKAQLGLGPPVAGGGGPAAEKAAGGAQVLRSFLCMDMEADAGIRKLGLGQDPAGPAEEASKPASERLWPMEDDEWDYMHFPNIFLKAEEGGGAADGSIPRYPSLHAKAAALPAAEAPDGEPITTRELQGVTVEDVVQAFQATASGEPGFLERFYGSSTGATGFKKTDWQEEFRIPGTLVCGLRYEMPLPKDVPSAVARLVSIPEATKVTTVMRMRTHGNEEAVLLLQTIAHDAPFGENFRTQEILRFQQHEGGVRLLKWAAVVWVQALAWHMSPVSKIIESKSIEGMRDTVDTMVKMLVESAAK